MTEKERRKYAAEYRQKNKKKLAEYWQKNKKKLAKQHAEYRQKNKKKIAKFQKEYRQKNKKKLAKFQKEYRQKNKKKIAEYLQKNKKKLAGQHAEYRQKNKKKIAKLRKEYRQKNKKKIAEYLQKNKKKLAKFQNEYATKMVGRHRALLYRHNKQLVPRGIKGIPMSLEAHRKKLYYTDGSYRVCWYCHGVTNKKGSGLDRLDNSKTYTVANTVPACLGCNTWRGSTHSVKETRDNFKPQRIATYLRKHNPELAKSLGF